MIPLGLRQVCSGTLDTGKGVFPIVCYGENANLLAAIPKGALVSVRGSLEHHTWSTGEHQERTAYVVVVKELSREH